MISGPLKDFPAVLIDAPEEHSPFGPSSAERNINCVGSYSYVTALGLKSESGPSAVEGTIGHHAAAVRLTTGLYPPDTSEEMREYLDVYVNWCLEKANEAVARGEVVSILVEQRVGIPKFHRDLWGSLDFALWNHTLRHLDVCDLKTGAGIFVSALRNLQVRLYAIYTVMQYELRPASMTGWIAQPTIDCTAGPIRPDDIPLWEIPELISLAVDMAKNSLAGGARTPGKWCRWCPAAAVCPEKNAESTEVMLSVNPLSQPLDLDKLGRAFLQLPNIREWIKSIEGLVTTLQNQSVEVPGTKLVNKYEGPRKWKDETAAEIEMRKTAEGKGDVAAAIYNTKLKTAPQFEKYLISTGMTKLEALEWIKQRTIRESSGTAVVALDDERPAVNGLTAEQLGFKKQPAPGGVLL